MMSGAFAAFIVLCGTAIAADPRSSETPASSQQYEDEEERLARAALERTLIRRGGLLLPSGTFELEPSVTYIHSSSDAISIDGFTILPVLVIGDIVSERIRRDTLIVALTARYGLPRDFQVEARAPFVSESLSTVTAESEEQRASTSDIGDIELALSRQIFRDKAGWPDMVASLRWKSDTGQDPFARSTNQPIVGTGFHTILASLSAVKTNDPVVFFGGLSYAINFAQDKPAGRVDPGDAWGVHLGMALAVNLNTSINASWTQRFTARTTVDGIDAPGSFLRPGFLQVGASYVPRPGLSVDVSIGVGLTRDAPDVVTTIAVPVRFKP